MYRKVINFFDKLEDRVRILLSRKPIIYALIGAAGIILLWKGVWETAELSPLLFGPGSILVGLAILLMTGLLVSFFVGDTILISGWRQEKKLVEKTESEVKSEKEMLSEIAADISDMKKEIENLERD